MKIVWYNVDDSPATRLEVDGEYVDDLVKAVIKEEELGCRPTQVRVFLGSDSGEPVDRMKKLVNSEDRAYIFHTPHYQQRLKRLKVTFDNSKLPSSPLGVYLQPRPTCSVFVSREDFLEEINLNIQARLDECDTEDGEVRVPPLAVTRCSRGGKTRTLLEIANMMFKSEERQEDSLAVLFITFNDFMGLSENEKKEEIMCQVFLRRVAFMATYKFEQKFHKERDIDIHNAFEDFRKSNSFFDQDMFIGWFNEFDGEIVLIIDELNNLTGLSESSREEEAKEFGSLLKNNFLCQTNRYFVFSSHVISSVSNFGEFIQTSDGSFRDVVLWDLPLVPNLKMAAKMYPRICGPREAIYYGLLPGLLYGKSQRIPIEGKRAKLVKEFWNENKQDLTTAFEKVCRSLITGSSADLSKSLEFLCDGVSVGTGAGEGLIRWIPYHLQFLMAYFGANHGELHIRDLAGSMATLCNQMNLAKEKSGDGWEGLFVLFLLARCIAKEPDGWFLPKTWFGKDLLTGDYPLIEYNNYDSDRVSSGTLLDQCATWKELSQGIDLTEKPTVSILYPTHAQFQAYDAFVVYSVGDKMEVYGYQLKEGAASTDQPAEESLLKSFVVRGVPATKSNKQKQWRIASNEQLNTFFGPCGSIWTPQKWTEFLQHGTSERDSTCNCARELGNFAPAYRRSVRELHF